MNAPATDGFIGRREEIADLREALTTASAAHWRFVLVEGADYTSCSLAATPSGSLYISNPATGRFDTFSNFYNGTSPNDVKANGVPLNPYFQNAFIPSYGDVNSFNYPLPIDFYFQVQVKL